MSKGLEALEVIKHTTDLTNPLHAWTNELNTIEKELKAWNIVSEYVDVIQDRNGNYYLMLNGYGIPINEEQYNVLKEAIE